MKVTGRRGLLARTRSRSSRTSTGRCCSSAVALVICPADHHLPQPDLLAHPDLRRAAAPSCCARSLGYGLTEAGVTVNGQSSSILSVLVLGAGTDYALLLVARYREELRRHEDKHEAIAHRAAPRGPGDRRLGRDRRSLALLCLSLAKVNGTAGLGPIGALGDPLRDARMLTLLPALLAICGRRAFWPRVPHVGGRGRPTRRTAPGGASATASPRRPAPCWIAARRCSCSCCALGLLNFSTGLTQSQLVPRRGRVGRGPEAARQVVPDRRQRADRRHRPRPGARRRRARAALRRIDGVAAGAARRPARRRRRPARRRAEARPVLDGGVRPRRPDPARRAPGRRARACSSAARPRSRTTCATPRRATRSSIIPLVAARRPARPRACCCARCVAPLLLIATVVLSFAAALGVGGRRLRRRLRLPGHRPVAAAVRLRVPRRAGHRLQHLPDGARARGDAHARHARRACCAAWP